MSWAWKGFFRDDPVFRFKDDGFFQSGRHAAEERFWKLKIHEDGSYVRRNASSLDNFYTMKDALRADEEAEEAKAERMRLELLKRREEEEEIKRREGSVEEKSQRSTETSSSDSSSSSSSDSSSSDEDEDGRTGDKKKKRKNKKKKSPKKEKKAGERNRRGTDADRQLEIERRERELAQRERELERQSRSREQTPEYSYNSYYYRSRRNSEMSNKDYPYSLCSEYSPSTNTIKEEEERKEKDGKARKGYYQYENVSSRYF